MALLFILSCDKAEQIPGYLKIDRIDLQTKTDRSQGSIAHDIVDAWVYVDNQFIGVFELPAKVPVLYEGEHEIKIVAGIKKNGLANERAAYPFFEPYSTTLNIVPGNVNTINAIVQYNDGVEFAWLEDFEDKTNSMEKSGSNSTVDSMHIESDSVKVFAYNGTTEKHSIRADLDSGYQIFQFATTQLYDLPRGKEIYLEFNYKTDVELVAGIYPITGTVVNGVPVVNFFATTQWKKAYVSLSEDINSSAYQGVDFRIFFGATKNLESPANVYLDNIKLVHF